MRLLTAKKLIHAMTALVFLLCYLTLMLVWDSHTFHIYNNNNNTSLINNNQDNHLAFQERMPRSIQENYSNINVISTNKTLLNKISHHNSQYDGSKYHNSKYHNSKYHSSKYDGSKYLHVNYMKHRSTNLDDIFISVKTTKSFHTTRLDIILKTWFLLAKDQTYFFTDGDDPIYAEKSNGHLINTNCSSSHNRKALCCKMSVEFDKFLESNKRWFCHFDDDNYVNVPQLVKLLSKYNPLEDWYLGKPSIRQPLEILNRDNTQKKISFWFATGGAGFCLSRAVALKMIPFASDGKFISIGEKIRLPDDVTLGYIIEYLLKKKLTVIESFHSHLEPMKFLKMNSLSEQVTFSYSRYGQEMNVLSIDNGIDLVNDPTRFLSLHCYLFPNFSFCPR